MRIVENKKEDMQDCMERAVSLVHLRAAERGRHETATQAGKIAPGADQAGLARVEFTDVIKPGDPLAVDVDATNQLAGLIVASCLDEPEDAVSLNVQFGALADGTNYTSQTTFDAKARNVRVVIQNSATGRSDIRTDEKTADPLWKAGIETDA